MAEVTPVTLLLGPAGAGKSTLVQRAPPDSGLAVLAVQPEPPLWWNAGCPCCAPRDDVTRGLRALLPRARQGDVRRVVIETTGLADPGPILAALLSDTVAACAYRLDAIVTVVDAATGTRILAARDMAVRQVTAADRIVLSRAEQADTASLRARLMRLNPAASIVDGHDDPLVLLGGSWLTPDAAALSTHAWLAGEAFATAQQVPPVEPEAADGDIDAFILRFDQQLPGPLVMRWLEGLIVNHADALLRIKAILNLQENPHPVAIHSLRHLLHPPIPLSAWPPGDPRSSRLLFITRGLPRAAVTQGLPIGNSALASAS